MSESVVLCEGFHDRAFWAGLLGHLGCSDEGYRPDTKGYPAADPWGSRVTGGKYAYRSPSGAFVRVVPCGGKSKILPQMRIRLEQRTTKQFIRLVVNVDTDVDASSGSAATGLRHADVLRVVQELEPSANATTADEIEIDYGATKVALVRWETLDAVAEGIPNQQSLERLVCAAMVAAHPDRAKLVHAWLRSRSQADGDGPKEFAWSYMAGWYAEHGCEDFFVQSWREPQVRTELIARLQSGNAWRIAEMLAG